MTTLYTVRVRRPLLRVTLNSGLTLPIDTVISVNDLQLDYVRKSGYVNLRCVGSPGCPAELKPASYLREHSEEIDFGHVAQYPRKFPLLLPDAKIPEVVGVPCCAQFAVSREQVLKRGREEYERMRQVVVNSELDDETTGRLFEYLWHSEHHSTGRNVISEMLTTRQSFLVNRPRAARIFASATVIHMDIAICRSMT